MLLKCMLGFLCNLQLSRQLLRFSFHDVFSRLRSQKVVIGIDIDDIGNLEDLLRAVFINEKSENLKVVVESIVEMLTKRRSQTFYRDIDLNSVTNSIDGAVSSISK